MQPREGMYAGSFSLRLALRTLVKLDRSTVFSSFYEVRLDEISRRNQIISSSHFRRMQFQLEVLDGDGDLILFFKPLRIASSK